jgi:Crp-like helix-turn-helix domain
MMSDYPATPQSRPNPLLRKLTPRAASLLSPCLELTQLVAGDRLESPRRPIAHLFFPDTALVSFAALGFGERPIEVGTAGYGGVTGISLALGSPLSPPHLEAVVELAGSAWRLAAEDFRRLTNTNREIRSHFLHLAFEHLDRVMQGAAANANLDVERRLARWLLVASEAQGSDVIRTTHDRLAALLGVRRPSVTLALQSLQVGKFVQQKRGAIELTDKHRLSRLFEAKPAARHGAPAAAE